MKSMFARHAVPEMVILHNDGPQNASQEFHDFAELYRFQSVTSSHKYLCSNGAEEKMVKTVKSILKKYDDQYLRMLTHRNTPIHGGISPAELLMSRRLHNNTVQLNYPITTEEGHKNFQNANNLYKVEMKERRDRPKQVQELPTLRRGNSVNSLSQTTWHHKGSVTRSNLHSCSRYRYTL